jgi:glycosyltransferase involved in cell wall biosynthesis
MRVLMVIERYLPIWGGAENQLHQIIPHLAKRGATIQVVTRRWHKSWDSEEMIDGVSVKRLGVPGFGIVQTFIFCLSLSCYIIIHRKKIDILHSHGAAFMGALCSFWGTCLGVKNVAKIATAGRIPLLAEELFGTIALFQLKKSSAIIAMTDEIEAELKGINVSPDIITRITNGVDGQRFKPASPEQRRGWRLKMGLKEETPVILFSSRLVKRKGLDILLDAWPIIIKGRPDAHLFVVGSGNDQRDSIEKLMKKKVVNEGLKQITFVGASKNPESFLAIADIFVFPSRLEGFPNALIEAMAAGIAVVASRIGGVIAVLRGHTCGLTFMPEDSNDVAQKVLDLLQDSKFVGKIGKEAREFILNAYSFQLVSKQYYNLYSHLMGSNSGNE